jgi:predicted membrane-bound spermidine synthase
MRAKRLLPALLLLSGFCGISYEILYAKLLGNLLGDRFTISASVLLTFLLGIGFGTLYAHRFVRKLWAIEAGIGLYAALMVVSYGWIDQVVYERVPLVGTSIAACAVVSIVLLAVPAFLVGCSVPLFAAYLSTLRSTQVFSMTYGVYNFGAALTALTLEFVLLRSVGLRAATLWLALLNGVVAAGLLLLMRTTPLIPPPRENRLRFAPRDLTALVLVSVASAIFQLLMIKVAECVIGPFNETFSLVLAVVLLGLALGSLAVGRLGLSFRGALFLSLAGLTALLALHSQALAGYAALRQEAIQTYPLLVLLKFGLVALLMGVPAIGFGATIPALLRTHQDVARESGQLLFLSSLGNAAGFALMAFVLHRNLDYGPLILVIITITAAGLMLHLGPRRPAAWAGLALVLFAVAAQRQLWNESLLYYGHEFFFSTKKLQKKRNSHFLADRFKGFQDVFAITWMNGKPSFFINGYISIPLTAVAEKVAGALSVMAAPRTDNALVLGVGSGATAATVGLVFEHTDAVEINAVILKNLHRMAEYNFDIEHMPSVSIIHDDGIHFVKTAPRRYSLIVNTVTTPIYFSSSKMYTRDFLRHVVAKLEPDGVYTTWVDRDLGHRGVDIILETLDSAFEECWLSYLKSSYYLLTCSNAEIAPHQSRTIFGNETLSRYLAQHNQLASRMIPYSLLSTRALSLRSADGAPVNTLDFPVLEHEMARLNQDTLLDFNRRLQQDLDLPRIRDLLADVLEWKPGELALWSDVRTSKESTLRRILHTTVPLQFGDVTDDYARAALEVAEEIGSPEAYALYGKALYERGTYREAIEAFSRLADLDPEDSETQEFLGRCYEKLDELESAGEHYRRARELASRSR